MALPNRSDDDGVDLLRQQVLDIGHLLGGLPVGFDEDELADVLVLRRGVLHLLDHLHDPGVADAGEGHADAPRWCLLELVGLGLLLGRRRHQAVGQQFDIGGEGGAGQGRGRQHGGRHQACSTKKFSTWDAPRGGNREPELLAIDAGSTARFSLLEGSF
jgi:hypothetical protein